MAVVQLMAEWPRPTGRRIGEATMGAQDAEIVILPCIRREPLAQVGRTNGGHERSSHG